MACGSVLGLQPSVPFSVRFAVAVSVCQPEGGQAPPHAVRMAQRRIIIFLTEMIFPKARLRLWALCFRGRRSLEERALQGRRKALFFSKLGWQHTAASQCDCR